MRATAMTEHKRRRYSTKAWPRRERIAPECALPSALTWAVRPTRAASESGYDVGDERGLEPSKEVHEAAAIARVIESVDEDGRPRPVEVAKELPDLSQRQLDVDRLLDAAPARNVLPIILESLGAAAAGDAPRLAPVQQRDQGLRELDLLEFAGIHPLRMSGAAVRRQSSAAPWNRTEGPWRWLAGRHEPLT